MQSWAQSKVQKRAKLQPIIPSHTGSADTEDTEPWKRHKPAAPISRMGSQSCRGHGTHGIPVGLKLQLPEPQIKHGDIAYVGLFAPKICRIVVGAVDKPETGVGVL